MTSRRQFVCLASLGLAATIAGCATDPERHPVAADAPEFSAENFSLDDVVAVVGVGTTSQEESRDRIPEEDLFGALVFIHSDGSVTALDVGHMASGHPQWVESGIYYGGADAEYWVSGSGVHRSVRSAPRQHTEIFRYPLADGSGVLAYYNYGATVGDYAQYLVENRSGELREKETRGILNTLAWDGQSLYCVASSGMSSSLTRMLDDPSGTSDWEMGNQQATVSDRRSVLLRLYPWEETPFTILGVSPSIPGLGGSGVLFPAAETTVSILSQFVDNDAPREANGDPSWQIVFDQWDISTGERNLLTVTDASGDRPALSHNGFGGPAPGALIGEEYMLIDEKGSLWAINVITGLAEQRWTAPELVRSGRSYQITDTGVYAFALSEEMTVDGRAATAVLRCFDLADGHADTLVNAPAIADYFGNYGQCFGIAMNPALLSH